MVVRCSWFAITAVVAALGAAACDSNGSSAPGGITTLMPGAAASTSVRAGATVAPTPLPIIPTGVVSAGCPSMQPYSTNLMLNVQAGPTDLFLDRVSFNFIDGSSVNGSAVAMSPADLAARFPSTSIPRGQIRAFGFQPAFGCGLTSPTSVVIGARLVDAAGRAQQIGLTVPLR